MAFGGSIKLTGESEYRKAVKEITSNLKVLSSELKLAASNFDKNDNSIESLSAANQVLNKKLQEQAKYIDQTQKAYNKLTQDIQTQAARHKQLETAYEQAKTQLKNLGNTLGETSEEYIAQKKVVDDLSQEYKRSTQNQNANEAALVKMQVALNKAKTEYNETARTIEKNNQAIKEQENATDNAADSLDDMKQSLLNADDAADKANSGFTILKGALANLVSQGISKAIDGLKQFGSTMITTAASVKAQNSKFEQAFGEFAGDAESAVKRVANATGIVDTRLKDTAANIFAFARSSGASVPEAMELMETALMATADSAAYYDKSLEESAETLQSFLKGNYANDAALGVSATEFTRNAKAAELFGKKYNDLSEIQKQQTLLKMVTDSQKLAGAMGQAARETDGFENVTGNLSETWKQFKAKVGTPFLEALIPVLKQVTEGFKKWADSVNWDVFARKVSNTMETVKKGFNWFMDNKNVFISAISGMIAAFSVVKLLSFVGTISTAIKAFTTAKTAVEGVSAAMKVLNISMAVNPWVLLAGAIAGVTVALGVFIAKNDTAAQQRKQEIGELKTQGEAIQETATKYDELNQAKQDAINTGFSEMSHYKSLYDEMETLVDENGKVKEGYEGRVSFILGELNNALGTEITMTDGVISKYSELKDSIDTLIEKKKAQIVLEAQEAGYKEAIQNRADALVQLNNLEIQIQNNRTERNQKQLELERTTNDQMRLTLLKRIEQLDNDFSTLNEQYNTQEDTVKKYAYNINQYETNMALAHAGNFEAINNTTWESVNVLQNAGLTKQQELQNQINQEKTWLDLLRQQRQTNNDATYDDDIAASEKRLAQLQSNLNDYVSTIQTGNTDAANTWQIGLSAQLAKITGFDYQFKDAGNGMVQTYINGVKTGQPVAETEMKNFIESVIKQVEDKKVSAGDAALGILIGINGGLNDPQKQVEITNSISNLGNTMLGTLSSSLEEHSPSRAGARAGGYLLDGVKNGIDNREKRSSIFGSIWSFGTTLLANLQASLDEHSPSKKANKFGQYLLEGLGLGIKSEEKGVLDEVSSFGNEVVDTLSNNLNNGNLKMNLGNMKATVTGAINYPKTTATREQNHTITSEEMVGAFKRALSEMKIELDDEVAGKFVRKTVTRAVFN